MDSWIQIANDEHLVFLQFGYGEIRDLLKHFLTLISATLVFSVTFSEKVIDFHTSSKIQRYLVIVSWFLLVFAFGSCGIGLYTNYLTAEAAIAIVVGADEHQFQNLIGTSYLFQDLAGVLFGGGLFVLILSTIFKRTSPR